MSEDKFFLDRPNGEKVAYRQVKSDTAKGPGILWLGGYASDMLGTKAEVLHGACEQHDRQYTRFDYTGHGESSGEFEDGCISDWADDALAVLDELTEGPQILVGSSMGGWIACLLAKKRPDRIGGILFLAPAPDFATELMWPGWDEATREKVMSEGKVEFPSEYDDSVMVYTRKLYEDGKDNRIFSEPLAINAPVRIVQGMLDDAVPWQHAVRLAEHIDGNDVQITLLKSGDHRLSSPQEVVVWSEVLEKLLGE